MWNGKLGRVVAGLVGVVLGVEGARGEVTRVATFENFVEGQNFKPGFVDPQSGIRFRDSTHLDGGFTIDYSTTPFGTGNYLTAGGVVAGPGGWLGAFFGFTADLPEPARRVGMDVTGGLFGISGMAVRGFDSAGVMVAEVVAPVGLAKTFQFELVSGEYDIVRVQAVMPPVATGYDNIRYTVLPEPGGMVGAGVLAGVWVGGRRGRAGRRFREEASGSERSPGSWRAVRKVMGEGAAVTRVGRGGLRR
jgi:hypothetical protein